MNTNKKLRNPARFRAFVNAGLGEVAKRHFRLPGTASGPTGGPSPTPNATFDIAMIDGAVDQVVPYYGFFRAQNLAGFAVSEPVGNTNVVDLTQQDIEWHWTGLSDTGYLGAGDYTPVNTPNLPNILRDPSTATSRQVAGIWHIPGAKTIHCYGFDLAGNWGTATLTRTLAGSETLFSGDRIICVRGGGDSVGAPAGAQIVDTVAQAMTAANMIRNGATVADRRAMVLLRAGQIFTDPDLGFGSGGSTEQAIHIGSFGAGVQAVVNFTGMGGEAARLQWLSAAAGNTARRFVVDNIEIRGPWKSWEETGLLVGLNSGTFNRAPVLITRVRITGLSEFSLENNQESDAGCVILHDYQITNWANYGIAFTPFRWASIWGDIHQHPDALMGINQGTGSQAPTQLGNRHGCIRGGSSELFMNASSFFNRGGWSLGPNGNYVSAPPTASQAALRLDTTNAAQTLSFNAVNKCAVEGGFNSFSVQAGIGQSFTVGARNFHVDGLFVMGNYNAYDRAIAISTPGFILKNAYVYRPNIIQQNNEGPEGDIFLQGSNVNAPGTSRVFNCTVRNELETARLRGAYAPLRIFENHVHVAENNLFSTPARSFGTGLNPLGTTPLAGFLARDKGGRWNFPPIGGFGFGAGLISVETLREGGAGPVANNEWISVPYPNYTGLCNGAGMQVTRAMVEGAGRFHIVSITARNGAGAVPNGRNMSPAAAGGNGRVAFAYTDTHIRIQNLTGVAWTFYEPSAGNFEGHIWIQLDLADQLMAFLPNTSVEGMTVPAPVPGVGSAARVTSPTGRFARQDFMRNLRKDARGTDGVVVTTGVATQGAFAVTA